MSIPKLDPQVKYVGASKLRELSAAKLRELSGAIVVQASDCTPLAVIVPFDTWQRVQLLATESIDDKEA